ncbi:MAG: WG repeat-containing protein [Bacteroidales bacterium]|nr:WG repeat-containing protein [Bacteroidales bacterium]
MKKAIFLILFIQLTSFIYSQCCKDFITKGKAALEQGNTLMAKRFFEMAKTCPDASTSPECKEIDKLIEQCMQKPGSKEPIKKPDETTPDDKKTTIQKDKLNNCFEENFTKAKTMFQNNGRPEIVLSKLEDAKNCPGASDNPKYNELESLIAQCNQKIKETALLKYDEVGDLIEKRMRAKKADKWGFIDLQGRRVIPFYFDSVSDFKNGKAFVLFEKFYNEIPGTGNIIDISGNYLYDKVRDFSENKALFQKEGLFGYLDQNLNEIIPAQFDYASSFSEGFAVVAKEGLWGCIDKNGKMVVPYKYRNIKNFNENMACIKNLNNKYGFINKNGQEVIPCKYDDANSFNDERALVKLNNFWGYIDVNGKEQLSGKFIYLDAFNFYNGKAYVSVEKDNYYIIDKNYNTVNKFLPFIPEFDLGNGRYIGLALFLKGIVDENGKNITPFQYSEISYTYNDLISVKKNDLYGYINRDGVEIIPCQFDLVSNFNSGRSCIYNYKNNAGSRLGLIDTRGVIVVPYKYYDISYFSEGKAAIGEYSGFIKKYGFIDIEGKVVISPKYDECGDFHEGKARVCVEENETMYCSFINHYGDTVFSCPPNIMPDNFSEGMVEAIGDNFKTGYYNYLGELIIPFEYDLGKYFTGGVAEVKKNGKKFYINKQGKCVLDCE